MTDQLSDIFNLRRLRYEKLVREQELLTKYCNLFKLSYKTVYANKIQKFCKKQLIKLTINEIDLNDIPPIYRYRLHITNRHLIKSKQINSAISSNKSQIKSLDEFQDEIIHSDYFHLTDDQQMQIDDMIVLLSSCGSTEGEIYYNKSVLINRFKRQFEENRLNDITKKIKQNDDNDDSTDSIDSINSTNSTSSTNSTNSTQLIDFYYLFDLRIMYKNLNKSNTFIIPFDGYENLVFYLQNDDIEHITKLWRKFNNETDFSIRYIQDFEYTKLLVKQQMKNN